MALTAASPASPLRRWWVASILLLGVYLALSLVNDPRGSLGTDTGGKVATVRMMSQRGDFVPDVGYWAASADPTARFHGLYTTLPVDGRFIQVTTVPMVLAARPLWDIWGYRGALLLPMLGGVATALAARALAQRLGDGDGSAAFWFVGLATPVAIYALDFWEHSIGLGLMAWGAVVVLDIVEDRVRWAWAGGAGALFGLAFSMRTEAAVYGAVLLGLMGLALLARGRRGTAVAAGLVGGAGALATTLATRQLEVAVIGESLRSARVAGTARSAGIGLSVRVHEALVTTFNFFPSTDLTTVALSMAGLAGLGAACAISRRNRSMQVTMLAACMVVVVVLRLAQGFGFIPGMLAAAPLGVLALVLGWNDRTSRALVIAALAPMPLVFLYQFPGGAVPQWGARYLLCSGFLLAVVGFARRGRASRPMTNLAVGTAVVLTVFGLVWMSIRTHGVAETGDAIEGTQPVLVAENGFLPREFGATYPRQRWLALNGSDDLPDAVAVLEQMGEGRFGYVTSPETEDAPPMLDGWRVEGADRVPFLGVELSVIEYQRASP
jgi:hypothetical protein